MEFIQWEFQHPGAFVTLDDERMIISGAKNGGKTAPLWPSGEPSQLIGVVLITL